ncbi:MAG: Asp-tRNA(Asn)/Glu-tRNA(Gln) amidotransferase subunit GatC [Candidatus Cardinium sp.]|uniref:Asp-tRNA(Asn)/Glu-tRNA(Gln) amidotransferase subunit GatC n=1 Tax=Cardinium endosymbiont of Dermatophagoides farinae TaxID=2597823 RepID=UPI0011839E9E|nr:Asp-tRNA(Asn)/Glu-tRNA(Gln) amidotransferase subunit GatC [Cardinium endosymbiont of Dermatophagoides farinae]TSJ80706.1 Asp-tRNA(Asn)/Glu-tRNA(Gln) amidotransferase subunit GatC [Cardinium endosymbiont of Dermatophagoides farinae]UWW96701.1 MAG: Asp-tRNA(Asn)/Glu-tRNA(Gln) amidotransferase subunit GatC [Candidatus Cardinium sp.]
MIIDNDLLNKLAYLCRLELLPHERDTMLHDLNAMVDWVNQLDELDVDDNIVLEESFKLEATSLRSDVVSNLLGHKEALALAPSNDSNYFRVPAVKGVTAYTDDSSEPS